MNYKFNGTVDATSFTSGGQPVGGLPESEAEGRVLVGDGKGDWEQRNAVPMSDNLVAPAIANATPYGSGPTGGLTDISSGQEAYLQEVKGMTVVWNQLVDAEHSHTCQQGHYYVFYSQSMSATYGPNSTSTIEATDIGKLVDLTLMFGGNNNIPFSLTSSTEYSANGEIPAQDYKPQMGFLRLFANATLNSAYDAGTIKNVKATKLVETGRNLWNENDADMVANGLQLLAGYRYEVYLGNNSRYVKISYDNGQTWSSSSNLTRYQRADGKYVWTFYSGSANFRIKAYSDSSPIKYIGFVHSGNYCLTAGTNTSSGNATTTETIPAYQKYEFTINGIDGLNGVGTCYDTKDMKRIESVDLSTLTWTDNGNNTFSASITGIKPETTNLLCSIYYDSMTVDANGVITIGSSVSPTGDLFYELETPVSTGQPAFEPIPLKSGDNWVVNDMGLEYFIQPANTNCPVNQVSYYYENLKDKLVNMSELKVTAASFNGNSVPLEGIRIGDANYRLLRQPSMVAPDTIALGIVSNSQLGGCVIIGTSSIVQSQYDVAIGQGSAARGNYSIAIGSLSNNPIHYSITSDGTYSILYHCTSPEYIFFRNEQPNKSKKTTDAYVSGHKLSEFIQSQSMIYYANDGKYYISMTDPDNYKTFSQVVVNGTSTDISASIKGVHIIVTLSNDVVASLDLLPYNTTDSKYYIAYGIASDTPTFVSAYISDNGALVITPPTGLTVSNVQFTIR